MNDASQHPVSGAPTCPHADRVESSAAARSSTPPPARLPLTAYCVDDHAVALRPASPRRAWMDAAVARAPYRCLPLTVAGTSGWEMVTPFAFEALWTGGALPADVTIVPLEPVPDSVDVVRSHFGEGILTFRPGYLFRTAPGYNLYVCGPPNAPKDGISPLTGIVETDWLPFSFTMNWAFTRVGVPVHFERDEPFAHFFPIPRGCLESVGPEIRPIASNPELERDYLQWSHSRQQFLHDLHAGVDEALAAGWQRYYVHGNLPDGRAGTPDHETKVRVRPFRGADENPG